MPTLEITKGWDDTQVLTEAHLDEIKNDVETFLNVTKLDADNLQDSAVTAGKLATNAVTTIKINANAVTRAKLEAVGQQVASSSTGSFSRTNTAYGDVTNATVTVTSTGRPVMVFLQPDGAGPAYIRVSAAVGTLVGMSTTIKLVRDSTDVAEWLLGVDDAGLDEDAPEIILSPSSILFMDAPAADEWIYKLQAKTTGNGGTVQVELVNCDLVAYEL